MLQVHGVKHLFHSSERDKMKTCTKCGVDRPETDYHWHYRDKGIRRQHCKFCRSAVEKERQQKDNYKIKRKEYCLQKNYGITQQEYDDKLQQQNYSCYLCKLPVTGKALAVDHCHATGKVRDLLCSPCNQGLGLFKDNPQLLRLAAEYIEKHG